MQYWGEMNVPSNGALGTRRGFMPQNPFTQRTGLRSMMEQLLALKHGSDYQPSGFAKKDISNFSFYDDFNRKPDEAAKDVRREALAGKGVLRGRDRTDLLEAIAAREPNTRRPYDPSSSEGLRSKIQEVLDNTGKNNMQYNKGFSFSNGGSVDRGYPMIRDINPKMTGMDDPNRRPNLVIRSQPPKDYRDLVRQRMDEMKEIPRPVMGMPRRPNLEIGPAPMGPRDLIMGPRGPIMSERPPSGYPDKRQPRRMPSDDPETRNISPEMIERLRSMFQGGDKTQRPRRPRMPDDDLSYMTRMPMMPRPMMMNEGGIAAATGPGLMATRNYGVDRAGNPLTEADYNWIVSRGGEDTNNDGRINSQELEAYHRAYAAAQAAAVPINEQALADGADVDEDGIVSEQELYKWRPSDGRYGRNPNNRVNRNQAYSQEALDTIRRQGGVIGDDGVFSEDEFWEYDKLRQIRDGENYGGATRAGEFNYQDPSTWNNPPPPRPTPMPMPPSQTTYVPEPAKNPYVFGGYGSPPPQYSGMADPRMTNIVGMAPTSYYGGEAE